MSVETQSPTINIGTDENPISVDVAKLLDSRLLIQAMSGGGKSRLLRRLAEELTKHVPVIIIDREGEFSTLLEVCDMLLIGGGGAIAASIKTAGALARRLVEARVSAVIDLSDLSMEDKREYVREFIHGLMHVAREFWKPLAVLIDEAHDFAPQSGDDTALAAVNSLMSQGRKRGFGTILATQRLSKLNKDSAAECANICIGKTSSVDKERAADLLGIPRKDKELLPVLLPCHWFAVGPAFGGTAIPVQFEAGQGASTHPEAGKRHEYTAPEPSAAMLALAAQFKELEAEPAEGEDPEDLEAAKEIIRELRERPALGIGPEIEYKAYVRGFHEGRRVELEAVHAFVVDRGVSEIGFDDTPILLKDADGGVSLAKPEAVTPEKEVERIAKAMDLPELPRVFFLNEAHTSTCLKSRPQQKILDAIAWFESVGIESPRRTNVAAVAGVSPKSSGFEKNLSALSTSGYLVYPGSGLVKLTTKGMGVSRGSGIKATLKDLHSCWLNSSAISKPQRHLLAYLIEACHRGRRMLAREKIAADLKVSEKSSGFEKNLSTLSGLGLIRYPSKGHVTTTDLLFPEGLK